MYIYGTIRDRNTGETLPQANIYFSDAQGNYTAGSEGTAADENGYYSIHGTGDYLTASYTGYKKQITPAAPGRFDFALTSGIGLPEVVIKGKILWPRILAGLIILVFLIYLYKKLHK
jgi:hypothetical protein